MKPTLVSAFIYDEKHYQNLDFYIKQGGKLLSLDFNKVIFIDEKIYHHFNNNTLPATNNILITYLIIT